MKDRIVRDVRTFLRRTLVAIGIVIVLTTILPIFLLVSRLDNK